MEIQQIRIKNFRRLDDISIQMKHDITLFVGANNSGKSSALLACKKFLTGDRGSIKFSDFSISCLNAILNLIPLSISNPVVSLQNQHPHSTNPDGYSDQSGNYIISSINQQSKNINLKADDEVTIKRINKLLPEVHACLQFDRSNHDEVPFAETFYLPANLIPNAETSNWLHLALRIDDKGLTILQKDLQELIKQLNLSNVSGDSKSVFLKHIYNLKVSNYFKLEGKFYIKQSNPPANNQSKIEPSPDYNDSSAPAIPNLNDVLKRLFKVTLIPNLSRLESGFDKLTNIKTLTDTLGTVTKLADYATETDKQLYLLALQSQREAFNQWGNHYSNLLNKTNDFIANQGSFNDDFNIPKFSAEFNQNNLPVPVLQCWFPTGTESDFVFPEENQGLGTRNLTALRVCLATAAREWRSYTTYDGGETREHNKAFCHLVLLEEPEANLNSNLERLLPSLILESLKTDESIDSKDTNSSFRTKILVTTHSLELTKQLSPQQIVYFKRLYSDHNPNARERSSKVVNLCDFSTQETTEKLYFLDYYQVLFADGVVIFEGDSEIVLVRSLLEKHLASSNNLLDVSIANLLRNRQVAWLQAKSRYIKFIKFLLQSLDVPTLFVTDLDFSLPPHLNFTVEIFKAKIHEAFTSDQNLFVELSNALRPENIFNYNSSNGNLNRACINEEPTVANIYKNLPNFIDGSIIYATQLPIEVTHNNCRYQEIPRSLEEAFILENFDWISWIYYGQENIPHELLVQVKKFEKVIAYQTNQQIPLQALLWSSMKNLKKTHFAHIFEEYSFHLVPKTTDQNETWYRLEFRVPSYITTGLQRLEDLIQQRHGGKYSGWH